MSALELPRAAAVTLKGDAAEGEGEGYRLRPGWPTQASLEYVQKLATSGLLILGFVFLAGYAVANPGGAFSMLVRGARSRAGVG